MRYQAPHRQSLAALALGIGLLIAACTPAPTASPPAAAQPSAGPGQAALDTLVAAAKKEGEVLWSNTSASDAVDAVAAKFQQKYGIKVNVQVTRPPDFNARYAAEMAAGKQSMDIRTGGSPTMRDLDAKKLTDSLGTLPVMSDPKAAWIENPFQDIESGKGNSVFYGLSGYYLIANNQLCPPENCPKSYKDLADPKYKGMLLLEDPLPAGGSPGTRFVAYTYLEYGEEYLKGVAQNVAALSRSTTEGPKQVARGEYAMYVMSSGAPIEIWQLPKPHPFRLIVPEDGQMVLLSGVSFLQQAPHPNAAKLLTNYILSQEGQQTLADVPGQVFLRKDVKPADPEVVKLAPKLFPRNPDTFEFGATYTQYIPFIDKYLKERGLK